MNHPTSDFDAELNGRLVRLRADGLLRELRQVGSPQSPVIQINGRDLLNFSSNDYLGLANHPALKTAAIEAVKTHGAGSGSARLICGSLAPHHELEATLADFKGLPAALAFASGYAAAVGTISALVGKEDVVVIDKLVHASIVDAARLSGAKLRVFAHNDLDDLARILAWADRIKAPVSESTAPAVAVRRSRTLVITESVFSMDGDGAPLALLVALKEKHGAWLMVDEAHATGLYGNRRGLIAEAGLAHRVEIQMGTLGKAIGAAGGYICGSRPLIDYLVNRARSFIFSTAPVPAAVAAAKAGIQLIASPAGQELRDQLWQRMAEFQCLRRHGQNQPSPAGFQSAIIPIPVGDEKRAVEVATALREQGIFVPAIRYPTVARGQARLRVTLTAAHSEAQVKQLTEALTRVGLGG